MKLSRRSARVVESMPGFVRHGRLPRPISLYVQLFVYKERASRTYLVMQLLENVISIIVYEMSETWICMYVCDTVNTVSIHIFVHSSVRHRT